MPPGPDGAGRLRVARCLDRSPACRVTCLAGPGRCVCRWAAARPRDRHTRACGSEWSISRPALALPPPINFARNSPAACLNIEFASLELQRFWGVLKNDRDKLRAKCGWRWCRRCPWAPQPDPVGQVARLSETAIAFARLCLWGIETAIAFVGTGRTSYETAIASASENWVFLARFSLALVLPVSMGVVHGRALVMVVSRWPSISGCRGVGGFTVTTSVRPEREKVRPAWSGGGCEREKVRPARSKHPKIGLFTLAGRTFSRVGCWRGRAGRTFSRVGWACSIVCVSVFLFERIDA